MKLSEENKNAFLLQIHQIIYQNIKFTLDKFESLDKNSLEHFALTEEEENFINTIKSSSLLQSILKKILINNLDNAFLDLLSIIDGVSEPLSEFGKKTDFLLVDMPEEFNEHYDFLHDEFFETYDTWEQMHNFSKDEDAS
ncbi:hypothetical protein ACFSTE_05950 [Aquimarina hainanensis]|uniref:Uncharacterized protein n=1 Tax=Aquimarina hainanensis TaxID=1578017 RepID=A0ABW5N5S2_9FLAO